MPSHAEKIEKPSLLLHGDPDIVALPNSSKIIFDKLASKDKTFRKFQGADHWFYQSIIPTMSTKYTIEQKRTVSSEVKNWLKTL